MASIFAGMAEVTRQIRVARRIYESTNLTKPWIELSPGERRPFIDKACQSPYGNDDGYNNECIDDMKFVALDFETANESLSSMCQVATVEFNDERVIDAFTSLVDPQDYFSGLNIGIHGISKKDVAGAPNFTDVYPELVERLSGKIVVSHTPFDRSALRQATVLHQLPEIKCRWLDSARVVRRTWLTHARQGYGLHSIASKCGIEFQHHDAHEDARTAGFILLRAIAESGISLEGWMTRSLQPLKSWVGQANLQGNPSGALFGEYLVFTGALQIPRREASEFAVQIGCTVLNSVTRKTSILVTGDQDIAKLSEGQMKSIKRRKAEAMIKNGDIIRIIGEADFKTMCSVENGTLTSISREQYV